MNQFRILLLDKFVWQYIYIYIYMPTGLIRVSAHMHVLYSTAAHCWLFCFLGDRRLLGIRHVSISWMALASIPRPLLFSIIQSLPLPWSISFYFLKFFNRDLRRNMDKKSSMHLRVHFLLSPHNFKRTLRRNIDNKSCMDLVVYSLKDVACCCESYFQVVKDRNWMTGPFLKPYYY